MIPITSLSDLQGYVLPEIRRLAGVQKPIRSAVLLVPAW